MSLLEPVDRLVVGADTTGRGRILFDGSAPNAHPSSMSAARGHTDLWVWDDTPITLAGTADDGQRSYVFPGSVRGGHLRVVQSVARPASYNRATDRENVPAHPPRVRPGCTGVWDRGGNGMYSSSMHKTQTVDFGLMVEGSRELLLDEGSTLLRTGDVVIQVGAWHQWGYPTDARMAFAMIGANFPNGNGNAVGDNRPMALASEPPGIALTRRVVTIDRPDGCSAIVSDGPCPDVLLDPARPGFASQRMWLVERCPAPIVHETLHLPRTLEPRNGGSLLLVDILPPDQPWMAGVGESEARRWFERSGSPAACAWRPDAPHPYMKHTRTFDYCVVMEGEATLLMDDHALTMRTGQVALLKGVRYAWSNRSNARAVVASTIIEGC